MHFVWIGCLYLKQCCFDSPVCGIRHEWFCNSSSSCQSHFLFAACPHHLPISLKTCRRPSSWTCTFMHKPAGARLMKQNTKRSCQVSSAMSHAERRKGTLRVKLVRGAPINGCKYNKLSTLQGPLWYQPYFIVIVFFFIWLVNASLESRCHKANIVIGNARD